MNDVRADVVSITGHSDNRSPALQFSAADPPRRSSPRQPSVHSVHSNPLLDPRQPSVHSNPLLDETGDQSRVPQPDHVLSSRNLEQASLLRSRTGISEMLRLQSATGDQSRASSPQLVVCKHLDNDEDADGDEENDDSDCSAIGGPGSPRCSSSVIDLRAASGSSLNVQLRK